MVKRSEVPNCSKRFWMMLVSLAIIFAGPMIVSWSLYRSQIYIPETLNYGRLITPPLQWSQLSLKTIQGETIKPQQLAGHWLLLYINSETCEQLCEKNLYKMRQVRLALGKNMTRVKRIVLTFANQNYPVLKKELAEHYPKTIHLQTSRKGLQKLLMPLSSKQIALRKGYLYIIDPLGNIMMSYEPNQPPKGILKDIKRLLKTSQIG